MHRDIKPDNIGFDVRDDIKLFDFGLSKELVAGAKPNDVFKLTGCAGTLRYMAPEVVQRKKYGMSADVFSFGILFWQILSCDLPFSKFSPKRHYDLVVQNRERPMLDSNWPSEWSSLINNCWAHEINERLSMTAVMNILGQEYHELCLIQDGCDERGKSYKRRKSSTSIFFKVR